MAEELYHLHIRTVLVDKTEVAVLAVALAPSDRLVDPLEPVESDQGRVGSQSGGVVPVALRALSLRRHREACSLGVR
jgi:hypothetical protein